MRKIIYSVFAMVMVLSIVAPMSVFAALNAAPSCSEHGKKICCAKDGNSCCGRSEEAMQNKLVRGRAGQVEWVRVPSVSRVCKCADFGPAQK
jgi:hypothetical protein